MKKLLFWAGVLLLAFMTFNYFKMRANGGSSILTRQFWTWGGG